MLTPLPTAAQSRHHQELETLFENWAQNSFDNSIKSLRELEHFEKVRARLQAGEDLSDELTALKRQTPAQAMAVLDSLIDSARKDVEQAWALKSSVARLFNVSVRQRTHELSTPPCFDVQYQAQTAKGTVTVLVATWRRNITVTVEGRDEAAAAATQQLVVLGMRDH
jgi:hypothetical protein